ncbi:cupin-like domain-containing protein [Pseudoxanthomonas composti]|uniref:Transcriptional regulator n=1 Tax=Pseudoxanthomonas composti TaxID=2137479 RepID=A0A4V1N1C1_9GAMM|nr:cupin-like domain-containing protein [Pseudoxanthomonas composti]RXR07129.1 transcriptional regulator [Pseudoxanthomonas composti]
MGHCFGADLPSAQLDRAPFKFQHQLLGHPALTIEGLAESLPRLPSHRVMYSKGLSDLAINFDRAHIDHHNGMSLVQTIETIRTSSSYIAVRDPQDDPAFQGLYADLCAEVTALQRQAGRSRAIHEPRMWLFIASPNAQTPFHFDRYSNFLMQLRGSKQVAVFPNFREDIVPQEICESYMARNDSIPLWRDELDRHAIKFDFKAGEAIHIPYISGHYVKNGPEDVSISMAFFFQTDETLRWSRAMQFNHRLRKLGLKPGAVGASAARDTLKSTAMQLARGAGRVLRRGAGQAPAG